MRVTSVALISFITFYICGTKSLYETLFHIMIGNNLIQIEIPITKHFLGGNLWLFQKRLPF